MVDQKQPSDSEQLGPPDPSTTKTPDPKQATASDTSSAWIGGIVWAIGIITFFGYQIFSVHQPDILLDVLIADPIVAKGSVMSDGMPVTNGSVHLVFEDGRSKRYLGSTVLPVTNAGGVEGTFNSAERKFLDSRIAKNIIEHRLPVKVTAVYEGQTIDSDSKQPKRLSGESSVYIGVSPPLSRLLIMGFSFTTILLILLLVNLFTNTTWTQTKARMLFSFMYLMTFLSIALPLAITLMVSQNFYTVELMEEAPIGLVKGRAKGVDSVQWILNIGGTIQKSESTPDDKSLLITGSGSTMGQTNSVGDPTGTPSQKTTNPVNIAAAATLTTQTGVCAPLPGSACIQGGLAIPFYVIFLAMLGAGINMTRQVPTIQEKYAGVLIQIPQGPSLLKSLAMAPMRAFVRTEGDTASEVEAAKMRKELINNYMYLLSAPFLAVAVYYLLQMLATNVSEPTLVIMAFATGLVSDSIVRGIETVGNNILSAIKGEKPQEGRTTREQEQGQGKKEEPTAKVNGDGKPPLLGGGSVAEKELSGKT